ncbi:MAG: hypothetical protein HQL51_08865 [Magnetococcales bacterium]|nr:hypothetical protein [Magnetococcales bacterium]
MAASEVSICNAALLMLGAEPIASLNDGNNRALACRQFYADARDTVLRAYPWNFAIRRTAPARLAERPAYGFAYQYALPVNPYCLRILDLEESIPFRVEGRNLLCDAETVNLRYIARIEDPTQFDALFVEALSAYLAAQVCFPITRNTTRYEALLKVFHHKLDEAQRADTQEGTPAQLNDDDTSLLINIRS